MAGTWPGRRLPTGNPPPPPPSPSLPLTLPSVSYAVWPVHTSCLCEPGMLRIQTPALLPAAAQQGALTPPPPHAPCHPGDPPLWLPSGFTAQPAGCLGGCLRKSVHCVWFVAALYVHTAHHCFAPEQQHLLSGSETDFH